MSAQPRRTARVAALALAGVLLTAGCAAGQVAQTAYERPSLDGSNATVGNIDLRAVAIQAPPNLTAKYRTGSDAFLNAVFVNSGQSDDRLVGIRTSAATSWAYFRDHNDAFAVQQAGISPSASASTSPSTSPSDPSSGSAEATPSGTGSTDATGAPATDTTGTDSTTDTGSATDSATASPATTPLPTGTKSVTIPVGGRVGFGTPESTGGLLLTGLTKALNPGDTVRITFTFAKSGSVSVAVPVQLSDLPRTAAVPGGEG